MLSRRHVALRVVVAVAGGLLLLWLSTWLLVPWLVKSQALPKAQEALGRSVTVQDVQFQPWRLSLTLHQLKLGAAPGAPAADALLEVEQISLNLSAASLWHLAPVIEGLAVDKPLVRLARTGEGRYSIDDVLNRLIGKPQAAGAPDEPTRFAIYNLQLRDGSVLFDDQPVQRRHELKQLRLDLPFLSNLATDIKIKVEPRLAGVMNGVAFDSGASAQPFAETREASLKLHLAPMDLQPYLAYAPKGLPLQFQQGSVATDLVLDFKQAPKTPPQISLKGQIVAAGLRIAHADGQPWVDVKRVQLGLRDVQPLRQQAAFSELLVEAPSVAVQRLRSGALKLPAFGAAAASPATAPPPNPWRVSLDRFALNQGSLQWQDDAVSPGVALAAKELVLELKDLSYPAAKEAGLQFSGQLQTLAKAGKGVAAEAAHFKGEGSLKEGNAALTAQLDGLPLGWLASYAQAGTPLKLQGVLGARVQLSRSAAGQLGLGIEQVSLDNFTALDGKTPALAFKRLELADTQVDLQARKLQIGALRVKAPSVRVERGTSGGWNAERWSVASDTPATPTPPWAVQLKSLHVDEGRLDFSDAQTGDGVDDVPVHYVVDGLKLEAQALDLSGPSSKPSPLQLQARLKALRPGQSEREVTESGTLDWRGSLALQPLAAQGSLRLDRLPLQGLDAYLERELRLDLRHGELGYRGDFAVSQIPGKGLQASASGDVLVGDLKLLQRAGAGQAAGDDLLSWQALNLKGLKLAWVPGAAPKIDVAELTLSDFFAKLAVSEQGRFNIGDIRVAQAPAAAASAVPAEATPPVQVSVGATRLAKGRVDFSDHFVRPNYSADISNLQGSLGAFRSGSTEMAALDLRGTVAGTGLLEITGRLNPSAQPLMLDINAKASDLELAPLSPYAAKYAGYAIERGKLSMDVSYRVQPDGRLEASNQLVLNQLTFGERVDSPDATKLPVLLAVALLKDSNGVIDVRLPVSGSVNDPQFSVSGIVFKLILNLLGKALTSPFSLLAGGEGQDLSYAEFLPGSATLKPQGDATLAKVAKALQDRPALSMTVTGAADPLSEREAMQTADLDQRLLAERRRELQRSQTAASTAAAATETLSLTPADRERLIRVLYKNTDMPGRPRNVLGLLKDVPAAQMEAMLKARILVTDETGRALALARGVAVRDALIASGLPNARLFLAAPRLRASGEDDAAWSPRVVLSLEKH